MGWSQAEATPSSRSVFDLAGPGSSQGDRSGQVPASPSGLSGLGAVVIDGVVADGGGRAFPPGRRHRAKVVTGIDDHSRICVCARLVVRASARPVCDALGPIKAHGLADQVLTDIQAVSA